MDDLDAYEYRLKFDACRAELAALRDRAEGAERTLGDREQDLIDAYVAADNSAHVAKLATERVALLEGLLRKMLSAFSEGEQWWRGHSGRCSETCTDDHRCCALYAEVLAALADGG